jgi:hypothetical protein
MLDKFFETMGQELAKRWLDYLFGPAFLFWAGGMGLYIWKLGWDAIKVTWQSWEIYQQVTAILAALLVVFVSSLAIRAVQLPVIRILEGYWPWPLNNIASYIVSKNQKKFAEQYKALRELKQKEKDKPITPEEQDRLFQLEDWAHCNPASAKDLLPTRLGNLLRSREMAPSRKYGLDALICWPRLWCLLPECIQENLTSSRDVLNQQAELWLWGLLFLVWTALNPLVVLISLMWMFLAYRMTLQTAAVYGDLMETAFDLHRFALYDALGWPRPKDCNEEKVAGARLTEFLWRGAIGEKIVYPLPAAGGK